MSDNIISTHPRDLEERAKPFTFKTHLKMVKFPLSLSTLKYLDDLPPSYFTYKGTSPKETEEIERERERGRLAVVCWPFSHQITIPLYLDINIMLCVF